MIRAVVFGVLRHVRSVALSYQNKMIGIARSASAVRAASFSGCARQIRVPASAPVFSAGIRTSSPFSTVPLSYDLHEPAKPVADKQTSPIIVMHGLFGSKKNNRTISK
jgi:hypothetical protein